MCGHATAQRRRGVTAEAQTVQRRLSNSAVAPAISTGISTTFKYVDCEYPANRLARNAVDRRLRIKQGYAAGQPFKHRRQRYPARVKRTGLNCPPPWLPVKAQSTRPPAPRRRPSPVVPVRRVTKQRRTQHNGKAGSGVHASKPGSASGLRVRVCINAPASQARRLPVNRQGYAAAARRAHGAVGALAGAGEGLQHYGSGSDFAPMSRLNAVAIISNNSNRARQWRVSRQQNQTYELP